MTSKNFNVKEGLFGNLHYKYHEKLNVPQEYLLELNTDPTPSFVIKIIPIYLNDNKYMWYMSGYYIMIEYEIIDDKYVVLSEGY